MSCDYSNSQYWMKDNTVIYVASDGTAYLPEGFQDRPSWYVRKSQVVPDEPRRGLRRVISLLRSLVPIVVLAILLGNGIAHPKKVKYIDLNQPPWRVDPYSLKGLPNVGEVDAIRWSDKKGDASQEPELEPAL